MNRNKKKFQNTNMNEERNNNNIQNNLQFNNEIKPEHQLHSNDFKPSNYNYLNQHLLNMNQMSSKRYQQSIHSKVPTPSASYLQQCEQIQYLNGSTPSGFNNNSLLLRSMPYLNPIIMMNLLSSNNPTSVANNLQQWTQHQSLIHFANNRNILQQQQQYQLKQQEQQNKTSSTSSSTSSTSSSSDDHLNDSISNEYIVEEQDVEENNEDEKHIDLN